MKLSLVLFLTTVAAVAQLRPVPWISVPVPTSAAFRGLSVVDENTVWASGTNGTVIRTTDSGRTWSVLSVPQAENLDFRGIHAFDVNTAVLMSSGPAEKGQARVYRTVDAGKHWDLVLEEKTAGAFFDAVAFWDAKRGILIGDPVEGHFMLFTTDDGGATWQRVPSKNLPPALEKEGAFAASNSCLTVEGSNNVWFATGGASIARVFRSADRGKTWSAANTPARPQNASTGIFSIAFHDGKNGIAVGGDYQHPDSPFPNPLVTTDGGQTWNAVSATEEKGHYFSSVAIVFNAKLRPTYMAAGPAGTYSFSSDRWSLQTDMNFNAVAFSSSGVGPGVGWAVGPKGGVARWQPEAGNPSGASGVQH